MENENCECAIQNNEIDQLEKDTNMRVQNIMFEEKNKNAQTHIKPLNGLQEVLYSSEYSPIMYDRVFKEHDE